jgi:bla regulator protein blaR1
MTSFTNSWLEALGWTLLNSSWQALILLLLVIVILRIVPTTRSRVRYVIACAAMGLFFISSVVTFLYLIPSFDSYSSLFGNTNFQINSTTSAVYGPNGLAGYLSIIGNFIQLNMSVIVLLWSIGALLFTLRLVTGWWFIHSLQMSATILENEWSAKLHTLANGLGITKLVVLAESARIQTPMVIGFLKPIVFVPAGLLSGLSSEQIETIFLHELAHIRRHDYLVNLVQRVIESIFFFNPFVWILSNIIRREREFCCDDTVVMYSGSVKAYAFALAKLEEVRLSKSIFALSLAENKNQLLQRIKRLMEKSAKQYSGKDRLVPAVLLVVGLICASWLTIQSDQQADKNFDGATASDTTIKKQDKSMRYSRKSITRYDEEGVPHEEVVESYSSDSDEGDAEFDFPIIAFDIDAPTAPDAIFDIPDFPQMPSFDVMPVIADFDFPEPPFAPFAHLDTIPGIHFRSHSGEEWEEFREEFQERFQNEFGEFYKTHQKELEKMMNEMEKKFSHSDHLMMEEELVARAAEAQSMHAADAMVRSEMEAARAASAHEAHASQRAVAAPHPMHSFKHNLKAMEEQMHAMEADMQQREKEIKIFESKIIEQLIKDGYLKENERIENMQWDNEGDIIINDKVIAEKDRKKYQELHDMHFKRKHSGKLE